MHHQRPNVISPKWWAIPEREPTGGLAIPLCVVTRRGDEHLNVPFEKSASAQNYLILVLHLDMVSMHSLW